MGIEGAYLNIVKTIYKKTIGNTSNSIFNEEKVSSLRSGIRQRSPLSPLLFNIDSATRWEREMKGIQIGKAVKLNIHRWYYIQEILKFPFKKEKL